MKRLTIAQHDVLFRALNVFEAECKEIVDHRGEYMESTVFQAQCDLVDIETLREALADIEVTF